MITFNSLNLTGDSGQLYSREERLTARKSRRKLLKYLERDDGILNGGGSGTIQERKFEKHMLAPVSFERSIENK